MAKWAETIAANRPTFIKLLTYSVALFVLSLGAFFLVRSDAVAARLELSPFGRDVASAASAVVASYFVIGLYAWSAMAEEDAEGGKGD